MNSYWGSKFVTKEFISPPGTYYIAVDEGNVIHGAARKIDRDLALMFAAAPQLAAALKACRDELLHLQDGSLGGVPNTIVALIPERIAQADEALALLE